MLLAINTATPILSLALVEGGRVLAEASQDVGNEHSEAMFVLLDSLFAWVGRPRSALSGVGVAIGPGGFTGLRSGLTLARTIAQVRDLPVYGIETLPALAYQFPGPHRVSAMLDARRGLVFAGLYHAEGDQVLTERAGALYPLDEWLAVLNETPGAIALVGEGAMRHRDSFEAGPDRWWLPPDALMAAGATAVGLLAERRLQAGMRSELAGLAPLYLREPQAVVNWEAAQVAKGAKSESHGPNP